MAIHLKALKNRENQGKLAKIGENWQKLVKFGKNRRKLEKFGKIWKKMEKLIFLDFYLFLTPKWPFLPHFWQNVTNFIKDGLTIFFLIFLDFFLIFLIFFDFFIFFLYLLTQKWQKWAHFWQNGKKIVKHGLTIFFLIFWNFLRFLTWTVQEIYQFEESSDLIGRELSTKITREPDFSQTWDWCH